MVVQIRLRWAAIVLSNDGIVGDPPLDTDLPLDTGYSQLEQAKTESSCVAEGSTDPQSYQQFNDGNYKSDPHLQTLNTQGGGLRSREREGEKKQHRDKGKREK